MISNDQKELARLVSEARAALEEGLRGVEAIHSRDIEALPRRADGTSVPHGERLGSRRFTRAMGQYLDHPPQLLTILRDRKYRRQHPRNHNGTTCGCRPRLGYRLVWNVVGNRTTIERAAEIEGIEARLATRVVISELKAIENELGRLR